jgi:hypothetical protein
VIGGDPGVFFRTARDLARMVRAAPFKDVEAEPGVKLYGFPNNFVEKALGVAATTRNVSTLNKIVDLRA